MPSSKVKAAVVGKAEQQSRRSSEKSSVRFSITPENEETVRLQEDLRAALDEQLRDSPFKSGNLIEVDFTDTQTQEIAHGLNAPAKGFILVDLVKSATIRREDETSTNKINFSRAKTHIKLIASAACKAKIWVWC